MAPEPLVSAAAEVPAAKALSCPSCGGTLNLKAAGYTVSVACLYCGSVLDVANEDVRLITEYHRQAAELEIPLGTRGRLKGVEWEAIGYVERSEGGTYPWSEYLLFNPYHGYRWLITNGRGWSFGEMLTRTPEAEHGALWLGREDYQPFFKEGRAQVDYVLGEFYWRVRVGEEVRTDDWVRPGFMLSREQNGQEVSWTRSELLAPREIRDAFGVRAPRNPWPPLPHQPSPYVGDMKKLVWIGVGAALFVSLLLILMGTGPVLFRGTLPYALDGTSRTATLGPVTVTRPHQLIAIDAEAPGLENAWVDLDYALVDRKTQASYEAYGLAERYSGRDSDGDWTEGSRSATVKLAAVPAGTYDLVVDYSGQQWSGGSTPNFGIAAPAETLQITISSGAFFPGNALIALIFLLLPLLFFVHRHVKFEQARQDESDVGRTGVAKLFTSSDDD
ncbi:DUF4178 domain-containing protein [Sphingosinicella sp. BN140058]|uniref:DUF4178 domain-containing protein n=1 Tax=Sphingosinicella sp. BN140058 TaxID=1892855 RepID=UPI0013ED9FD0|nr:DUF4178 domain-containing protein [Sphingosinicella sp. BN140058]